MAYQVDGTALAADVEGYLLEANYSEVVCRVIAVVDDLSLGDDRWRIINYLREQFRKHGHTPSFRTMLKDASQMIDACDSKRLYDRFPLGPAKQGACIADLPKPIFRSVGQLFALGFGRTRQADQWRSA